jgi:hypothetical protein
MDVQEGSFGILQPQTETRSKTQKAESERPGGIAF